MTDRAPGLRLLAHPSSVAAARRFLSRRLATHVIDTIVAADAVLVVSELVTNAVLHGQEPIGVEISFVGARSLRIVVSDASPVVPTIREYGDAASTGRGLALVASLARRWGVDKASPGKSVWVELDATSADGTIVPPRVAMPSHTPAADDAVGKPVRFLGVPVDGYLCLQQHNDDILRELELLSFSPDGRGIARDSELGHVVDRARRFFRVSREGFRGDVMEASARGRRVVDLESVIEAGTVPGAEELVSLFEDAERLGAAGQLLLGPPDADVVHLRRWFVDELCRQVVDGEEPAPFVPLAPS